MNWYFYIKCEFETILTEPRKSEPIRFNSNRLNQNYGVIKMKNRKKLVNFAVGAIIAALYVVLTYLASAMGL